MDLFKFYLDNVLGPVFGADLQLIARSPPPPPLIGADGELKRAASARREDRGCERAGASQEPEQVGASQSRATKQLAGDAMIDLEGPPLIEGLTSWIRFYRLIGFINLPRVPLYVTLVYKSCVLALSNVVLLRRFFIPLVVSSVLDSTATTQNPIFVLIIAMTLLTSALNALIILHTNLFKLSPLFGVLAAPKLCFVKRDTQAACGNKMLAYVLILIVIQTFLFRAQVSADFHEFIENFSLASFLLEFYAFTVCIHYTIGLTQVDFYVRFCFGAWLLALKCNLEYRTSRYDYLRAQLRRAAGRATASGRKLEEEEADEERRVMRAFRRQYAFITLDEVQQSLNTMDDHLEVCRSIDTGSLVFITLNAFLATGTMLMYAYNLFTKHHDAFHGIGMLLIAFINGILVMLSYLGDSVLFYALSGFVQAVEDEYFLQAPGGARASLAWPRGARPATSSSPSVEQDDDELESAEGSIKFAPTNSTAGGGAAYSSCLAIRREEVMFCRELLHQFETHLATPWSKLTFKSHISMVAACATLIAAQIIFEHEHR